MRNQDSSHIIILVSCSVRLSTSRKV